MPSPKTSPRAPFTSTGSTGTSNGRTPLPATSHRASTGLPESPTRASIGAMATGTDLALKDYVLYELHVGTFTAEGTFDAAVSRLDDLQDLGVSALELMPVAQFPGSRNWGYDGVFPFAVQDSYGGPDGLKRLVDASHRKGLAVVLDFVCNHLGPEGNVLGSFGPYFNDYCQTPWGKAVNFDGPGSDEVRRFFIESALPGCGTSTSMHCGSMPFTALSTCRRAPFSRSWGPPCTPRQQKLRRPVHLIAESNLNAPRFIRPVEQGGCGLDGIWNDDFHHALHAILTGERGRYYSDFGRCRPAGKSLQPRVRL